VKDEEAPALGGNITKFTELSGADKSTSCAEYTMVKFTGTTGEEFVALQLALDFEDFKGTNAANPEAVAASPEAANMPEAKPAATSEPAASSEPEAAAVANTLDYGGVPNVTDPASAPDKGEEAKKPAAADAAKKPAAETTKPSYSPILDEAVTTVGICNKAHKKTQNII